jgi:hypothetical protein
LRAKAIAKRLADGEAIQGKKEDWIASLPLSSLYDDASSSQ